MDAQAQWERAVADAVSEKVAIPTSGVSFVCISEKPTIADASRVFIVYSGEQKPVAVVLQGGGDGDLARRGAERAIAVKRGLGATLGSAVLDPLCTGSCADRSYAIYTYCGTLPTRGVRRRLALALIRPQVLDWLADAAERSCCEPTDSELEDRFVRPLAELARLDAASDLTRSLASAALVEAERGTWKPRFVLMHGDLWVGNVLISPRGLHGRMDWRWWRRFVVSDWPGSSWKGMAIYDLVRFADSALVSKSRFRAEVGRHCRTLACEPRQSVNYLCAALADVLANLEHYPLERFSAMAHLCISGLMEVVPGRTAVQ